MTPSNSTLQIINEKEADLRRRIEIAHHQAAARLQAARSEAEQSIDQAGQEARQEAERLYRRGIEQAHQEAQSIVNAAKEEAASQERQALDNLQNVARYIMGLVLPEEILSTTRSAAVTWSKPNSTGGD